MNRWPWYSPACRKAVDELLKRGGSLSAFRANKDYGAGPSEGSYAWKLEREIERKFNVKYAVATNSGTAALHAGLASLDLRGGDVITSPYTFSATASAILLAGGKPVFADVDPFTFCITKETVKRVITKRTKAILPVHLFGGMTDLRGLREFGIPVIEDACQAVGARTPHGWSGTQGLAGCYSFNGSKNIPAGECGALVTNSSKVAEEARLLMNHGENFGAQVGYNYRPNELTCCVAYHGLLELEERNQRRIDLVKRINEHMMWGYKTDGSHVYYVYPFWYGAYDGRAAFIKRMKKRGITVGAGYIQPPLHHYKAFRKYADRELPMVDELSFKTLSILYCLTPDKELTYADKVAQALRETS